VAAALLQIGVVDVDDLGIGKVRLVVARLRAARLTHEQQVARGIGHRCCVLVGVRQLCTT
jgi:hypothetical protein